MASFYNFVKKVPHSTFLIDANYMHIFSIKFMMIIMYLCIYMQVYMTVEIHLEVPYKA